LLRFISKTNILLKGRAWKEIYFRFRRYTTNYTRSFLYNQNVYDLVWLQKKNVKQEEEKFDYIYLSFQDISKLTLIEPLPNPTANTSPSGLYLQQSTYSSQSLLIAQDLFKYGFNWFLLTQH